MIFLNVALNLLYKRVLVYPKLFKSTLACKKCFPLLKLVFFSKWRLMISPNLVFCSSLWMSFKIALKSPSKVNW